MSRGFIEVARSDEIEGNRPLAVEVAGVSLALVRIGGEVFALRDRCPHMAFPLSEGFVNDEGRLICSLHHWEFDLRRLDPSVPPELSCLPLPLREEEGRILVQLPPAPD